MRLFGVIICLLFFTSYSYAGCQSSLLTIIGEIKQTVTKTYSASDICYKAIFRGRNAQKRCIPLPEIINMLTTKATESAALCAQCSGDIQKQCKEITAQKYIRAYGLNHLEKIVRSWPIEANFEIERKTNEDGVGKDIVIDI
jgi:hypothetical protein